MTGILFNIQKENKLLLKEVVAIHQSAAKLCMLI